MWRLLWFQFWLDRWWWRLKAKQAVRLAATRHAADADFRVIVLEDCCAAFSDDAHRVSLHIMDHLATLATAAEFLESVQ